jgi:hypothetical protein
MAISHYLQPGLLAAFILSGVGSVLAAETATIPYAKLDEMWRKIDQINSQKLSVSAQVASKNKDIKPSAITMTIKSATGDLPIRIGPEGDLLEFPQNEALRKENPPIETNQPKGSLVLTLNLGLPVPATTAFPYDRFVEGLAEGNRVAKAHAGELAAVAPNLKVVIFVFPKSSAGTATVEIGARAGKKLLTADASSQVKILIDQKLSAENPEVKLSERPTRILLNSE